ncbi:hypothetical protein DM02DRAFT_666382 [Periconia macrospinosa]|uniref:Extracellular membrane protein CFEM domain-containing protein n=1 Tax=Periconia macrospinosa TaxID=97972 RepID=A0A2V1EF22_9PLEO|nr:hypothetical protein DM02DRAFT_666382 [Periconia macrospinosa]
MLMIFTFLLAASGLLSVSARKTSIFIDQIPLYSKLPECAENRISAIVRAQSSGCGDSQALTSFECFCIDQSTMMASIISRDVQSQCGASMTASGSVSLVTPLPQVTQAVDVFNSYCERSTELSLYQEARTSSSSSFNQVTVTATPTLTSSIVSPTSTPETFASKTNSVPIVAVVVPSIIAALAVAAIVGFLFWRRRKRSTPPTEHPRPQLVEAPDNSTTSYASNPKYISPPPPPAAPVTSSDYGRHNHSPGSGWPVVPSGWRSESQDRFELENKEKIQPVELDSGNVVTFKKGKKGEK